MVSVAVSTSTASAGHDEHPEPVDDAHRPPPVEPVGECAAEQREQEPRQGPGERDDGHAAWGAGQRRGEQGIAASVTPSPRFETVAALQSRT